MKKMITRRGFVIPKEEHKNELARIRKDLKVQPYKSQRFIMQNYGGLPEPFNIYMESESKIYMPRYYGISKFGNVHMNISDGNDIKLEFEGELRENQEKLMADFLPKFYTNFGGILNLKTGGGKTALALYIISVLKKKALIVVHKQFLADQWIDRINQFLPKAKTGTIQGKKIDIENCDIVIGMLQSISMKDFEKNAFDSFGVTVFDETHHLSANVFSRAFLKCSSKFNLGLSATLERKDETEFVLNYYLGPTFSPTVLENFGEVKVKKLKFIDEIYQKEITNFKGNINSAAMISKLVTSRKRTQLICAYIEKYVKHNRHILILSERLSQLKDIEEKLNEMAIESGMAIGGTKHEKLTENCKKPVILATYSYVSEGFDVETLNTLIFASPKSDVIQSAGRILRQTPEEREKIPYILDIVDDTKIYESKFKKRLKYYKKSKFTVFQ